MPIPLMLLAEAAQIGLAANKADQQKRQADYMGNMKRPIRQLPTALQEKQNIAKNLANSSLLPAQGYYENQMGAATSRANRDIQNTGGSANDIIAGLSQVDANNRGQTNKLIATGLENQQNNQLNYGNTLSEVAADQNEQFDYNQNQPYQSNILKQQSLRDASARNFNNAIEGGIDLAGQYDQGRQFDDLYGTNYYGGNGQRRVGASSKRSTQQPSMVATNPTFSNSNLGL